MTEQTTMDAGLAAGISRRRFFGLAGAFAGAGLLAGAAGCNKDDNVGNGLSLGSGDVAVLNYAYALEQLEAAFYTRVLMQSNNGLSASELSIFRDIRDHEIAHREFLKNALGSNAIGTLELDLGTINFASRDNVLAIAKAFEDLGVSAYNGAGKLLTNSTYLGLAGKIVSVEARHAATIRDLIAAGSFANSEVVDANGLDMSRTPAQVYAIADLYFKTRIDISTVPTI